jgi:transcriptional regulator with XRE-family HTH domain
MTILESSLGRIASAITEARVEHELSQTQLARLNGVSRRTIGQLEDSARIHLRLLLQLAAVILALDAHRPALLDVDELLERAVRELGSVRR